MRAILQRVLNAQVAIEGEVVGKIDKGLLVLVGFEEGDTMEDISWMVAKISAMRIFNDGDGKMNVSLEDIDGELLLVSQFTLHASTKKGNRPSFIHAAKPDTAIPLYRQTIRSFELWLEKTIQTGEFGADMQVSLVNDGPVTISLDSKDK